MQVPILNGIYTTEDSEFRVSYPRNLVPIPSPQGISNGYLRPGDGIIEFGEGPGLDRGAINWNDICYRVMGTKLVRVNSDGSIDTLADVGGTSQVTLDYSFDYLAIASNNNFYMWSGILQQVTDPDLGIVLDFIWVDGYFMTTDGTNLVVTELNDPFSVNPNKYGSSEAAPDPIKSLLKLRNEPHALNRYTIEVFDNVGGDGFPFARIEGAQINKGVIGTHACCIFLEAIAFMGGGRNEAISIWLGGSGSAVKISTYEIDLILQNYTEVQLAESLLETRVDKGHQHLYVHLPDKTIVYDGVGSQIVGEPIWFSLDSGNVGSLSKYRARNLTYCYNKWLVGDPLMFNVGYLTRASADHWGQEVGWEFTTVIIYNESLGAIFHEVELIALTGRNELNVESSIWTDYSLDGETYSTEKSITAGSQGSRNKRLVWLQQGSMQHWRTQRFRGYSNSMLSFARLNIRLEGLAV